MVRNHYLQRHTATNAKTLNCYLYFTGAVSTAINSAESSNGSLGCFIKGFAWSRIGLGLWREKAENFSRNLSHGF